MTFQSKGAPKVLRRLVLAASAILILGQALVAAPAGPMDRERARMRARSDTALEKLNISPDKKAKYRRMRAARRAATDAAKRTLRAQRMRLFALYGEYRLNESAARDAIKRINRVQLDLLNNSLERQTEQRRMLSETQLAQMRKMV